MRLSRSGSPTASSCWTAICKVRENVQAEVLDVILCEAAESEIPVYEVDCTSSSVPESADSVEKILNGDVSDYLPGKTDWSGEMDRWF